MQRFPKPKKKDPGNGVMLIDLAREAAEHAFGHKENEKGEKE
jgi:hypothetical protein